MNQTNTLKILYMHYKISNKNQAWWSMTAIPALRKLSQEDHNFESAWAK
jgi:hypothetical protein